MSLPLVAALATLLGLNLVASAIICRAESLTLSQRTLQLCITWLLPGLGAIACLVILRTIAAENNSSLDRDAFKDNAGVGHPLEGAGDAGGDGGGD